VEIAFEIDERNNRIVVFSAIDNMMKGSAGQAIHAANIAFGIDETIGLSHRSLHPTGAP
jgi:N-acetyl-gamma-glutamyl-phosphate/LysW-gamma-L-alpha-aminoadipyl-6-phosphate reductase